MKKIYGFFILIIIGIYISFLYFDESRIYTYTTQRYFLPILGSAIILIIFGFLGILFTFRSEKLRKRFLTGTRNLILDKKLSTLYLIIVLGIFVSQFFFLIIPFLILFPFKDSISDRLLSKNIVRGTLLIVVIISGMFIPSGQISSATANQRISNINSVELTSQYGALNNFSTESTNFDIGDWLVSMSFNSNLESFVGRKVDLIGFIFAPEDFKNDMFLISRFVVKCCAADARPVGLKVRSEWRDNFKIDEWVRIKGEFVLENQELIIIPSIIERADVPVRPYLD